MLHKFMALFECVASDLSVVKAKQRLVSPIPLFDSENIGQAAVIRVLYRRFATVIYIYEPVLE